LTQEIISLKKFGEVLVSSKVDQQETPLAIQEIAMRKKLLIVAAVIGSLGLASGWAVAQAGRHGGHGMHSMHGMHSDSPTGANNEKAAMGGMHHRMHGERGMHGGMGRGMQGSHDEKAGGNAPTGHGSHGASNPSGKNDRKEASTFALQAVNAQMHDAMNIDYTGKADIDFAKSMIPHHQGAIDMAKVLLAFGKSPELRKLADEIIKTQELEIARMNDWLKENGAR
jgi:uncharacterized protein (DUF305 family)